MYKTSIIIHNIENQSLTPNVLSHICDLFKLL